MKNIFWRAVSGAFIIFLAACVYVAAKTVFFNNLLGSNTHYVFGSRFKDLFVVFMLTVLLSGYVFLSLKMIKQLPEEKKKYFRIFQWSVIIVLQIAFLYSWRYVGFTTDSGNLEDMMYNMAKKSNGILQNNDGYFSKYPNNYFLTILLYKVYSIIPNGNLMCFRIVVRVINVICIDLGILFAYKIASQVSKKNYKDLVLMFCAMNPITYVWCTWVYTSIVAIPFGLGIVCLWIYAQKNKERCWLYYGIIGVIAAVGYMIRPTIIIMVTALVIIEFFKILGQKDIRKKRIVSLIVFAGMLVICLGGTKYYIKQHLSDPEQTGRYPFTHWVMLGLNEDGKFSTEDTKLTVSAGDFEQKKQKNIEEIKKRIGQYNVVTFTKHELKKVATVFAIGSDGYMQQEYRVEGTNTFQEYTLSEKNYLLCQYCNILRGIELLLALIAVIDFFIFHDEKIEFIVLVVFGAICFYTIWEANRKYSIAFQYFITLLGCRALHNMMGKKYKLEKCGKCMEMMLNLKKKILKVLKVNQKKIAIGFAIVTVLCLGVGAKVFVINQARYDKTIISHEYRLMRKNDIKDGCFTENFEVASSFNQLIFPVQVKNKKQCSVLYELYDENQNLLREGKAKFGKKKKAFGINAIVKCNFEKVNVDKKQKFSLKIHQDSGTSVRYYSVKRSALDYCSVVSSEVNGEQLSSDVAVFVKDIKNIEGYFSWTGYLILCAIVVLTNAGMVLIIKKTK
ncbi:MAG: glycosyltransferase family 39 protein [Lachnospiraceae bacterium]|nr:glycosyltransferase family 39 protein [Lachnospiraceae bacterium]